jgi:hypothetical protein
MKREGFFEISKLKNDYENPIFAIFVKVLNNFGKSDND